MMIHRFRAALLSVLAIATASVYADETDTKSYPVLSGVGIALRESEGELFVGFVVPDSPADKSGRIHEGDRLVAVQSDDKKTTLNGKTIGEAASTIRGPSGTKLVLTLVPNNTEKETSITLLRAPLALTGIDDASYRSFIDKPAPEMVLSTLDGKSTKKLSDYRGKVVVLDFWASWCPSCYAPVTKMQDVVSRHDDWEGRVEMITVTVDSGLERAVATVAKQGWDRTNNMSIEFDKLKHIGVSVVPATIVIAMDGTIATMAGSHAIDVEREVEALLAAQPNKPAM